MKSILIRAEDKNQWERRTPLTPDDLKQILRTTGSRAFVQKSPKRVIPAAAYETIGAQITEDMTPGDIILGIKEIPESKILPQKVYVFFSHTIKGQAANMPMLKAIITSGSTLIDYEKIIDHTGQRLVYFGSFAGDAGAIDILWLMGEYWRHHGITTPFAQIKQALQYASLHEAEHELARIGSLIQTQGLHQSLTPLVIGVLGYGNVSRGAQHVFDFLPVQRILPEELKMLVEKQQYTPNGIYLVVFKEEHLVKSVAGTPFDLQDYYQHPENYTSQFAAYLPYLSILVNGIYWDRRYPRFVTLAALEALYRQTLPPRLQGIADITCDVNGSIECNFKSTDPGLPAYLYHPLTRQVTDGHQGEGIVVLAVDNLPAELPWDASTFFSQQFKKFVPNVIQANYSAAFENAGFAPEIQPAVIVYRGELTPNYRYLQPFIQ